MAQTSFILSIIVLLIAIIGFLYTYSLGRRQKLQEQYDAPVNEKIQEHPYIRNPVLLAYVLAGLLALGMIIYLALNRG
ncbi:hypothetical protein PNH38_10945 [Anoxybacillus rupiensis]|jgi:hypothetical protein|uniref:Uncharacterized protein n=1 Tax=Anoxybacteroides rupiense TaxID=311460 RepID=A0ABD5IPW5_9BACL|nr:MULTISPECIES: hypothetical protein [Anoxybacillus]KXG10375.1 hypothetical protein AT864_00966 [Anoxybacillus sp. P3H1B]MBB3906341.1 hypothetical protein [Anoxybacillus rupiensis]MBS2770676.1 hypothetical protein [Anoxybacillus rupiensis]MDE8564393.1 hypothetical protein [Anoxybacillus rupiensis]MED5050317.1 hypothetical protein [Anoxybacillus rupiensis]